MINGLRFIIGNGCNYDCFFCHHEGYEKCSSSKYNLDNLEKIYHYAKKNNIKGTLSIFYTPHRGGLIKFN